jgi:hypothetical protein
MREIKKFIADDGREFESKEDCIEYENQYTERIEAMRLISRTCNNCESCPFWSDKEDTCLLSYSVDSWENVFDEERG